MADLHGVGLASSCLAIGKDGAVESFEHLLHNGLDGHPVQLCLARVRVKHLDVTTDPRTSWIQVLRESFTPANMSYGCCHI